MTARVEIAARRGGVPRRRARSCATAGVQAVAVCFLYGFVRTDARGSAPRASSPRNSPRPSPAPRHEVAPEFREFERLSTAVVNAYLGPVMQGYIQRLGDRLARARHCARRRI